MSRSLNAALFVICTGHFVATASARAGVIYVDSSATGPTQDGSSWCTAIIRLQDAIAIAQSGDEIRVAGGTYRPDQGVVQNPGDRTATFALKTGVVLLGGYAGCNATNPNTRNWTIDETVLSGDLAGNDGPEYANNTENSYHVVSYSDPLAVGSVLDGFTVCWGNADGTGPAELTTNQGSGINIRNGAERCMPGGPELRNCTIRDNWSMHHGAVNDHAFTTLIDNCTFRDNYSGEEGAGLLIHTGSATVSNSTFLNNHCDGTGGGVWTGDDQTPQCNPPVSSPSFLNCVFEDNSASEAVGSTRIAAAIQPFPVVRFAATR